MNFYIISPDADGRVDPTTNDTLYKRMNLVSKQRDADVVLVPVSYYHDYRFSTRLHEIKKPWVLFDYLEYYGTWNMSEGTHWFGDPSCMERPSAITENAEWQKLDDYVRANPPAAYFKRELCERDRIYKLHPLEFVCDLPTLPLQSEEEFNARPIEVFFCWGYSHPCRPKLHARIFEGMNTDGLGVISHWDQFEGYFASGAAKRTWASIFSPHYTRVDMLNKILPWHQKSKVVVSLPGAGIKCFRSGEAPVGSIMALAEDELAWSHPWVHRHNCLRTRDWYNYDDINDALRDEASDLYPIYVNSQATIDRYRPLRYINEYLIPTIQSHLS